MRFSFTSEDYNIFSSALFALTLITVMISSMLFFLLSFIIKHQKSSDIINSNIFLFPFIIFVVGLLNYLILFERSKHYIYVKGRNLIPRSAYVTVFLFFFIWYLMLYFLAEASAKP